MEVNFKLPSQNETHQLLTLIDPCSSGSFINQKHLPDKFQKQISNFIENPNGKSNNFGMKPAHIKVGGAFAQPIDVECVQIKFKVFIGNWYGFHQFYVTVGNKYILVAIDYYTKFCIAKATSNFTVLTTARFIHEDIICKHGKMNRIHTDQGVNFLIFSFSLFLILSCFKQINN